jgi:hypothetical protein
VAISALLESTGAADRRRPRRTLGGSRGCHPMTCGQGRDVDNPRDRPGAAMAITGVRRCRSREVHIEPTRWGATADADGGAVRPRAGGACGPGPEPGGRRGACGHPEEPAVGRWGYGHAEESAVRARSLRARGQAAVMERACGQAREPAVTRRSLRSGGGGGRAGLGACARGLGSGTVRAVARGRRRRRRRVGRRRRRRGRLGLRGVRLGVGG